MQRLLILSCFCFLLLDIASPAAKAQFYIGVQGGANFAADSDVDGNGIDGEGSFDAGYAVGGALGYRFDLADSLALDAEGSFTYRNNDVDAFSAAGFADVSGGDSQSFAWMANLWLNWRLGNSGFAPYIGGGFGGVHLDIDDAQAGSVALDHESAFMLGGQLGAGLGYQLGEHVVLSLDYRFLITEDADMNGLDIGYQTHAAMVEVKYLF
ncbi:MAG: hypothetical protein Kow00114_34940 [Kiloniellaceae bacterium]